MKTNRLMFGLLAGAMLTACSDDLSNEPTGPGDPNAIGAQGYIGISIGMPADPVTRGQNDQFDDGLEKEYEVKNAALIFFTGETANPTFYKAYSIGPGEWNSVNDNPPQITRNQIVTFPVDFAKDSEGDLWALAVINYGGIMNVSNTDNSVTINGTKFEGDFKKFMALQTTNALRSETSGFFMTNAPHSSVPGTTASGTPTNPKFQVLAKVNKERIFETEQAALQLPAAAIFVERAVAKVEVRRPEDFGIKDGAINFPEGNFAITSVKWVLDNVEPSSFLVRNLDTDQDNTKVPYWALYDTNTTFTGWSGLHYRFLGAAGFGHTQWPNTPDPDEHYRTYFCMDPNGTGIEEGKNLSSVTTFGDTGSGNPQYCKENTFDVAHMDYRNTTRAVIQVRFGDGKTHLYTVGTDKKNVYLFAGAASYLAWDVLYNNNVIQAWKDHFEKNEEEYANNANTNDMTYNSTNRTASNDWMDLQMRGNETTGRLELVSIKLKDGNGRYVEFDDDATVADINKNSDIKFFKEGVAYYAIRIRHFGNDLAPWTSAEETTITTVDSYGKNNGTGGEITLQDEMNYLGRYGVVRNNWYVVNLGEILQMGEPIQGDLPLDGTPDDRVLKEESISCRINILSWAKREQTDNL